MPDTFDVEIAAARAEVRGLSETVAGLRELLNDIRSAHDLEEPLRCEECGRESEGGADGWRTYLTVDDEPATYCPEHARAEFGDRGPR